jgi:hypothetical protein
MNSIPLTCFPLLLTGLQVTLSQSVWLYLLLALTAIAAAYFIYRFTLPPVPRVRKTVLWTLRGAALALIIFLLFEPVLNYLRHESKPPVVALLVDHSASMGIQDGNDQRDAELKLFLNSPALRDLGRRSALRVFSFADSIVEGSRDSVVSMPSTGIGTDIAGGWTAVQKALAGENLALGILVSDGEYNLGENPVRVASLSATPLYAVGVGDTSNRADAVVAEILTNEIVYVGSRVPVDVRVRARGLSARSTTVRLIGARGIELGRQAIRFASSDAEISAPFQVDVTAPGDFRLTAVVDSVPGEQFTGNNRRSVIVRALENKNAVALFAGAPSADLEMIRQSLEADTNLTLKAFVEIAAGKFLHNIPEPSIDDLNKSRLIVLCDFPTRATSADLLTKISRAAAERRIPILFMAGPHVAAGRLSSLSDVLPVQPAKPVLSEDPVVLRNAASHAAMTGRSPLPAAWNELPPVFGSAGNFTVSPATQVVVKLSRETLGIEENEPAIAIWDSGPRRGVAFLCWGTSRWKLQMAGNTNAAAFYDDLMSRLRGWLVAPIEEQRVKIRTVKKLFSGGERVRFVAQVYGADLSPRDDAVVSVQTSSGSRTESVPLQNRGNGRYDGEVNPWTEGEYRFSGLAIAGKDTLGKDQGLFAVEAFNIELIDTRARFDVLRQVADVSKAAFAPVSQADTMLARLKLAPRDVSSRKEISLWNHGPLIWIIISLLALEWIIRKRSGML